ncbi:hypothetical protein TrVE_jg14366 [Triparma verrucosa]|uniref:AB hydrolase-1 domain-containing protein n=1 Tax=Triparma verrucosa TaxID=1606542 RepID=A0A9W7CJ55_9STRA|nr:hypothetical protein TrVE_jg14366 [Triparma verrucosa]
MGANGFPAKVYTPVIDKLGKMVAAGGGGGKLHAKMFDYHPHLKLGVTKDWWGMVNSTIDEARALREKSGEDLVGVGHSAGGALIACAATKSPDLFKKVVLVDSPMFNPLKRSLFSFGYMLPDAIIDNMHPMIKTAGKKKHEWEDMKEAEEYVRSRKLFKSFSPEIVDAWLAEGLRKGENCGKMKLVFKHTSEQCMYKTTPMDVPVIGVKNGGWLGQYDAVDQAGVFLYSNTYTFLDKRDIAFLKSKFKGLDFYDFDDEHFWPMRDPEAFAKTLKKHI